MEYRLLSIDIGDGFKVKIEVGYQSDIFSLEDFEYVTKDGKKFPCHKSWAELAFEEFLEFSGEYWQ